jgi:hypothetical protein
MLRDSLTDAVAEAVELWNTQHCAFIVEQFLTVTNAANISQEFQYCSRRKSSLPRYRTVMGRKLQNQCFRIKKETTRQCAYSAIATEH